MAQASKPEKPGYVRNVWGFWNPYAASEVALRIQARTGAPEPGEACDEAAVRDGLRDLLDLAREPVLRTDDLGEYGHLCVCGGADSADGRRLWAWLVDQVNQGGDLMTVGELADRLADSMPDGSVDAFIGSLPATATGTAAPAPAELMLRQESGDPLPVRELKVLAAGVRRVDELTGPVKDAFLGQRGVELGPEWMVRRFDTARPTALRDFARTLATDLVARSQRVALSKAVRRPDGTLWLPTRLQERGGFLFSRGREGSGDVGLRIDQLTMVLAGAGVLRRAHGAWQVTAQGRTLLA